MSRTVITLVGIGAVVIAAGLGVALRDRLGDQATLDRTAKPAPAATSGATPAEASPGPASTARPTTAGATQGPATAAVPAPATGPTARPEGPSPLGVPTFDIARISPDGRAVIAGRGAPGAKIVLLNGGKEIARSEADSRGEWVIIAQDPPLSPGQHELRVLQHIEGRAPVTSEQVVVAIVPASQPAASPQAPKDQTLVMIVPPGGATRLVQAPSAAGVPKSGDLGVSAIDYDDRGKVTISGEAAPSTIVRAYVDDKLMAEGAAGPDGRWRLAPSELVDVGKHQLRIDRLAGDGKPVARLELPFNRLPATSGPSDTRRLIVVRGDNLWNIAHRHYGAGYQHTIIYEANQDQIRNPHLIYPGQVFTLPKVN
jgi:nucleoid-associated protein YgaU